MVIQCKIRNQANTKTKTNTVSMKMKEFPQGAAGA